MSVRPLDPKFYVTGQILAEDISEIARAGYKTVICMRPDGEGGPTQPGSDVIEKAASAVGLAFHYLPARPGAITPDIAARLKDIMTKTEGPILAYCASGGRCTTAYEMARHA